MPKSKVDGFELSANWRPERGLSLHGDVTYIKLEDPPVLQKLSRLHALTEGRIRVFGGLGGLYFLEELQRGAAGIMTADQAEILRRGGADRRTGA